MGLFSYIADSFTNRGALDLVTAKDQESLDNVTVLNETKPITNTFTPQANNVVAQEFAQQTMTALPRTAQELAPGQMGPPLPNAQTYSDPAAATRRYYERLVDQERARETARAQEQLSDPMFRFRDTMTDVARNTIGLPFNILSGGQAFNNDPSREAQSRHEARLAELDALNGENAKLYDQARDERFATLENLRNNRFVASTNRLNAVSQGSLFKAPNPDFYTVKSFSEAQRLIEQGQPRSEAYKALRTKDDIVTATDANGRPIFLNKRDASFLGYATDFDVELDQKRTVQLQDDFTKAQSVYFAERPYVQRTVRSFSRKRDRIAEKVAEAKELLSSMTTGAAGALQFLPETDARTLSNIITTLKSNIGFSQIQEMRSESKSGGALGQVTEKELDFLQSVLAKLDQFDDPNQLEENLNYVLESYDRTVSALEYDLSEMDELYGTSAFNARPFNSSIIYDGNKAFEAMLADPKPEDFPSNNADPQRGSLAEFTQTPVLTPEQQAELDDINAQIEALSTPTKDDP